MEKSLVCAKIIELPKKFQEANVSMWDLLKQSGYFEIYNQVSEYDLQNELKKQLDRIDDWLLYFESKRTSTGWAYLQTDKEKFTLAYYSLDGISERIEFNDKILALAAIIKLEAELIRKS